MATTFSIIGKRTLAECHIFNSLNASVDSYVRLLFIIITQSNIFFVNMISLIPLHNHFLILIIDFKFQERNVKCFDQDQSKLKINRSKCHPQILLALRVNSYVGNALKNACLPRISRRISL